ncbi:NAD(P)/FAD-dependent oxidoreductase [Kitasatospora sp. NPDC096147]|uniref:NAD(P)/FAD-dependent oxidoreductase n=1 Tax=Kitasatospora sp. NPDC096147 TaxID=3364093 RepID=UPI00382CECB9
MTGGKSGGHAVVAGAGIGGLLAARVLSETYGRVTVVDRDALPEKAAVRRGVPQSGHAHGMLAKGFQVLEELFPGLGEDLVGEGALVRDAQADVRWFNDGYEMKQAHSGLPCLLVSRPALERYLRSRVAALPGVELRDRCEVLEPVADASGGRITGVRVLEVNAEPEELTADLFVDSTGRSNRGEAWLRALGYRPAPEERIDSKVVYVSREYRRRPGEVGADAYVVGATGTIPRGGVALSAEGERWLVTMFGMNGDHPAVDPEGYLAFAERLASPELHRLLERLEPVTAPKLMRIPVSIRRRYERVERMPEGYLVFGDAICQFNPTYGQGMTAAACQAEALREVFGRLRGAAAAKEFFRRAAQVTDVPWDMSVGADLRYPFVEGKRTLRVKLLNWYVGRLHRAAAEDAATGREFLAVANLQAPPQRLFGRKVLGQVLRPRPTGRPTRPSARPAPQAGASAT